MTHLGIIPFLEHPLENWLFVIAIALIAIGIKIFLMIYSRNRSDVKPRKRPDDEVNPWEIMEKSNTEDIAKKKK
jgi:hypothetical protein